jgi:hypothetical protein
VRDGRRRGGSGKGAEARRGGGAGGAAVGPAPWRCCSSAAAGRRQPRSAREQATEYGRRSTGGLCMRRRFILPAPVVLHDEHGGARGRGGVGASLRAPSSAPSATASPRRPRWQAPRRRARGPRDGTAADLAGPLPPLPFLRGPVAASLSPPVLRLELLMCRPVQAAVRRAARGTPHACSPAVPSLPLLAAAGTNCQR